MYLGTASHKRIWTLEMSLGRVSSLLSVAMLIRSEPSPNPSLWLQGACLFLFATWNPRLNILHLLLPQSTLLFVCVFPQSTLKPTVWWSGNSPDSNCRQELFGTQGPFLPGEAVPSLWPSGFFSVQQPHLASLPRGLGKMNPEKVLGIFWALSACFRAGRDSPWPKVWWVTASLLHLGAPLVAQTVKNLPAAQQTQIWPLGWEDLLEKGMATHRSILTWRIPWTEEDPGGLQSTGSRRIRRVWAPNTLYLGRRDVWDRSSVTCCAQGPSWDNLTPGISLYNIVISAVKPFVMVKTKSSSLTSATQLSVLKINEPCCWLWPRTTAVPQSALSAPQGCLEYSLCQIPGNPGS